MYNNLNKNKTGVIMIKELFTIQEVSDITGFSIATVNSKIKNNEIETNDVGLCLLSSLLNNEHFQKMNENKWNKNIETIANKKYSIIELFAGAGGLAIGMEKAGFEAVLLNEWDKKACETLRQNRPEWNVIEGDVRNIDFKAYKGIDILSGGFPCQAFSHAGKRLGFKDTRGTLFFEFARAIKESEPTIFFAENVKGLLTHDNGNTMEVIKNVIEEIGYDLLDINTINAMFYQVPQKRERLFIVGVKKGLLPPNYIFERPPYYNTIYTLKDVLYKSDLFSTDVPLSNKKEYPKRKKEIMDLVPQGGCWKDLPEEIQKEYMGKSFYSGGGKTGMARRLSLNSPSLTLTCSPAQKQTERCHPLETRPLSVREYARIQTFPDDWIFSGGTDAQYKQIGNAVPVNLAYAMGKSLIKLLNDIGKIKDKNL